MIYKAKNFLQQRDLFSHEVEFNINRQGTAHGTSCGGCVSIILWVLYLGFIHISMERMRTYEDAKLYTVK